MKLLWLSAFALAWVIAAPVVAREAVDDAESPGTADESQGQDEVIVVGDGKGRRDRAIEAFERGDFRQAELEFDKNQLCVRRIEMLKEFAIEQAQLDAGRGLPFTTLRNLYSQSDQIPGRICERQDWQLYMMGLSQLQLGKYAEAKATFYRVIAISKDELLYDAHFRIALLEILDGNFDKAEKRLRHLRKLQRRCARRGDRCEIGNELDEVVAYLERAIKEAR